MEPLIRGLDLQACFLTQPSANLQASISFFRSIDEAARQARSPLPGFRLAFNHQHMPAFALPTASTVTKVLWYGDASQALRYCEMNFCSACSAWKVGVSQNATRF